MLDHPSVPNRRIQTLLYQWLERRLEPDSLDWLSQKIAVTTEGKDDRVIFTAFSFVPRKIGKADLNLSAAELNEAQELCAAWHPHTWSVDQAARALLLLCLPQENKHRISHWMEQLFTTAGLQELIALHQTLPLLPHPDRYRFWADEGVRSHITGVFQAIALYNPYPAWHFEEAAWNQMVLKAIFIDAPLHPITGLDQRRNPTLTRMLMDYIHERWAAHRRVTPEIWRLIVGDLTPEQIADLARGLTMDDTFQCYSIARCCLDSGTPEALALLASQGELHQRSASITWAEVFQHRQEVIPWKSVIAA
jgi:hypothetical protein